VTFLNFEHSSQPIASWRRFLRRVLVYMLVAACLDVLALVIGTFGFHFLESLGWLESALNAAMILTGNGPYARPQTTGAEIFQLCYALFGVFVFVTVVSVILTPVVHRVLHAFRLEPEDRPSRRGKG
jgi:hypothetical protein